MSRSCLSRVAEVVCRVVKNQGEPDEKKFGSLLQTEGTIDRGKLQQPPEMRHPPNNQPRIFSPTFSLICFSW